MMRKIGIVAVSLSAAIAGAAVTTGSSALAQKAAAGNVAKGREAYIADGCFQCHGRQGQGGRGPELAATALPYAAFAAYVRKPAGSMPPYGPQVLSDQAMADVYAFARALPGASETPPTVKKR